jgi:hypothetical protein
MKKLLLLTLIIGFLSLFNTVFAACAAPGTTSGGKSCPSCSTRVNVPANDCPSNPLMISGCGTAFSVPASAMCNATPNDCCSNGTSGGCSTIEYNGPSGSGTYANCCVAANFDCNVSSNDFSPGSIENMLFWAFQPTESCSYSMTISVSGCTVGSNVQWQVYNTSGLLPGGTILNSLNTSPNQSTGGTFNIAVTAGNYVYVALDGYAGACCNVSISIQPILTGTGACTGCTILLSDPYINLRTQLINNKSVLVKWNNLDETKNNYVLERSYDGKKYSEITSFISHTLTNEYEDKNVDTSTENVYYRLSIIDDIGESRSKDISVLKMKPKKIKSTKIFDVFGKEYSENNLPSGVVIYVIEFENGHMETKKEYNTIK